MSKHSSAYLNHTNHIRLQMAGQKTLRGYHNQLQRTISTNPQDPSLATRPYEELLWRNNTGYIVKNL